VRVKEIGRLYADQHQFLLLASYRSKQNQRHSLPKVAVCGTLFH